MNWSGLKPCGWKVAVNGEPKRSWAAEIAAAFKKLGFAYSALDLFGYRTGSMNEVLTDEI